MFFATSQCRPTSWGVCVWTHEPAGALLYLSYILCFLFGARVSDALQSPIWNTTIANNVKSPVRSLSDSHLCLLSQKQMWILKASLVLMLEYLMMYNFEPLSNMGLVHFLKINTGSPPCFHFQLPALLSIMVWTVKVMSSQLTWSLFSHLDYRPTKGGLSAVLWTF